MAKKSKRKVTSSGSYNPHESLIIQIGVVAIIVSGIALFAYAYAQYAVK